MTINYLIIPLIFIFQEVLNSFFKLSKKSYLYMVGGVFIISLTLLNFVESIIRVEYDILSEQISFLAIKFDSKQFLFFTFMISSMVIKNIFLEKKDISIFDFIMFTLFFTLDPSLIFLGCWWIYRFLVSKYKRIFNYQVIANNIITFLLILTAFLSNLEYLNIIENYKYILSLFYFLGIGISAVFADFLYNPLKKYNSSTGLISILFTVFYTSLRPISDSLISSYHIVFLSLCLLKYLMEYISYKNLRMINLLSNLFLFLSVYYNQHFFIFIINFVTLKSISEIYNTNANIRIKNKELIKIFSDKYISLIISITITLVYVLSIITFVKNQNTQLSYLLLVLLWGLLVEFQKLLKNIILHLDKSYLVYFNLLFICSSLFTLGYLWS